VIGFEFATAGRILFGSGTSAELETVAAGFGARALLVTGKTSHDTAARRSIGGFARAVFRVTKEPTIAMIREAVEVFRAAACDVVVAVGGGSAIDAGKAVAAAAANEGDLLDYVEVIGKGRPLGRTPYPFIAVPTTAGTGSEVTRNAVLGYPEHGVKASLRSPLMLARVAIVDPDLTLDLPPVVTAGTGLDALTQLIEPYVCNRANAMTDALCLAGMRAAADNLAAAWRDGGNRTAREAMCQASLFGGLALANAGLGVVHGFAAPIGGMFDAPHGAVCAALLPAGVECNIRALRQRAASGVALARYGGIARLLTGRPEAQPEDAAAWLRDLVDQLAVPPLSAWGVASSHVAELVEKAARASSMKANPILLTPGELASVLEASL
jgi:alcohol dehydrogenase class IV